MLGTKSGVGCEDFGLDTKNFLGFLGVGEMYISVVFKYLYSVI